MNACERLLECLKASKKERGFRKPVVQPDGRVTFAQQMVEVVCGDIVEACALAERDDTVDALQKGSATVACDKGAETRVSVWADGVFHLLDMVKAGKLRETG